jgi:hypothetical protein
MHRRILIYAPVGTIALYAIIAVSPMPLAIARDRPELASYFRPPLFNFSADYHDGHVLDFNVGATRDELLRTLTERYSETGSLAAACGRDPGARPLTAAESYVRLSSGEKTRSLVQRDVVCLHIPERKVLIFHVENEHVRKIGLTIVRTELP